MGDVRDHHSTTRIAALDGIRGVAILLVIVGHCAFIPVGTAFDRWVTQASLAGWVGVDLFFVLSGFLITGILLDTKDENDYLRNFFIRRALRILPLYYGALILLFVVLPLLHPLLVRLLHTPAGIGQFAIVEKQLTDSQAWYWLHATNLLVATRGSVDALPLGTAHFWSLAVEEQFYLVWPFVVLLTRRTTFTWICAGFIAVGIGLRVILTALAIPPDVVYTFSLTRCDSLAMGAIVAIAWRSPLWWPRVARGAPAALGLASLCVAGICLWRGDFRSRDPQVLQYGIPVLAIGFTALVTRLVAATDDETIARVFAARWLGTIGKYSYGMYVIHQAVILVIWHGLPWSQLPRIRGSSFPEQMLFTGAVTLASLGAAAAIWHVYEIRFIRLKERLTRPRIQPAIAIASAPLSGA